MKDNNPYKGTWDNNIDFDVERYIKYEHRKYHKPPLMKTTHIQNQNIRYQQRNVLIRTLGTYIENYIWTGWEGYFVSFMFNQFSGSPRKIIEKMKLEIQKVYSVLLPFIVRKPRSIKAQDALPVVIAFPDLPVHKSNRYEIKDVIANDGLHFHAIILIRQNHVFNIVSTRIS